MYKKYLFFTLLCSTLLAVNNLWGKALPERLADWKLTETKTYPGKALYDYINGGAEVYLEYGFSRVDVGYYEKGEQELLVEVYKMADLQSALGVYSFFRDPRAPSLPEPYTGKLYEFHLECMNGSEYIKLINYDSLATDERLNVLRDLVPKPAQAERIDFSMLLPKNRISESEVLFSGPIALKNFCPLGRKNFFGVGERARAYGCLIEVDGKQYKWVTVVGRSAQLAKDRERYIAFQKRNDYTVRSRPDYDYLEDHLTGNNIMMCPRDDRILWIFDVDNEEKAIDLIRSIQ